MGGQGRQGMEQYQVVPEKTTPGSDTGDKQQVIRKVRLSLTLCCYGNNHESR